jgi:hypothetical protein
VGVLFTLWIWLDGTAGSPGSLGRACINFVFAHLQKSSGSKADRGMVRHSFTIRVPVTPTVLLRY